MPRKELQTRKDWGYGGRWVPENEQDRRKDALEIPEELGLEFDSELKKAFEDAIDYFLYDKTALADPPRLSEIRATLEAIINNTDLWVDTVPHTDLLTDKLLRREGITHIEKKAAINFAKRLRIASRVILHGLRDDKGGRNRDDAQINLIRRLGQIFEKATGGRPSVTCNAAKKNPYSGQFFKLVNNILLILKYPAHSNEALGKAIQRALK